MGYDGEMPAIQADLRPLLPRLGAPLFACLVLAGTGLAMALTPPGVPDGWRMGGGGLLAVAAMGLAGGVARRFQVQARLVRASKLCREERPVAMRLALSPGRRGRAIADLAPVHRDQAELLAAWPLTPDGALTRVHAERPARRVPVLAGRYTLPPGETVQADVWVAGRLVVIRTKKGSFISVG